MTAAGQHRPRIAWRLACFRLCAGVLPVDVALLPGLSAFLW